MAFSNYENNRRLSTRNPPLKMMQAVEDDQDCMWKIVAVVCVGDVNGGDAPEICNNIWELICSGVGPVLPEDPIFPPPGDGGGGGSGPPNPTYDCNGDLNGSAYISECGCIGGNTGITSCGPLEVQFCDDVDPQLRIAIRNHIQNITAAHCAIKFFVQQLDAVSGLTLQICIDGEDFSNPNALYSNDGKITFRTDYTATNGNFMQHELFHAFQDKLAYNGGIGQYAAPSNGRVNIEFEQAVFADIIYGTNVFDNIAGIDTMRQDYEAWRDDLTEFGTVYPDLSNFATYENTYNFFLEAFNSYHGYGGGTVISLAPEALMRIFNNLQKNGCGIY